LTAELAEEVKEKRASPSLKDDILFLAAKLIVLVVMVVLMFTVVFGVVRVSDMSMKPAIMEGDLVFYSRMQNSYASGDLAVFEYQGVTQVRRVVAVAGDTINVDDKGLYINGYLQQENNIYFDTQNFSEGVILPITLKEGEIFVLGDKRDSADDSRVYGPIKISEVKGKVMTLIRRRNF